LQEEADNGNPEAMFWYGISFVPDGAKKLPEKACVWIRNSLYEGFDKAFSFAINCVPNAAQMEELKRLSAKNETLRRYFIFSQWRWNSVSISAREEKSGFDELIGLAEDGDALAQRLLLRSYYFGKGRHQNMLEAGYWFYRLNAADVDDISAKNFKDSDLQKIRARLGAAQIANPGGLDEAISLVEEEIEKRAKSYSRKEKYARAQEWDQSFKLFEIAVSNREFAEAKKIIQRLTSTRENASASDAFAIGEYMTDKELPELYSPEDALGWFLQGDHNQSRNKAYQKFGSAMTADELSSTVPQLLAEAMEGNGVAGRLAARVLVESENPSHFYAAYYLAKFFKTTNNLKWDYFRNAPYTKRRALWTSRELLDEVEEKLTSFEFVQARNRYDSCMGLANVKRDLRSVTRFKRCLLAQLNSTPITLAPAGFTLANETPDTNDLYLTELERVEVTEFYKELATRERERERERDREKRLAEYKEKERLRNLANQFQVKPTTDNNQDDWQKQLKDLLESDNPILETN
jgi:hypothetical protein